MHRGSTLIAILLLHRTATQHLITENVLRPRLLSVQQGSLKGVAPVRSWGALSNRAPLWKRYPPQPCLSHRLSLVSMALL